MASQKGILKVRGIPENWLRLWLENKLLRLGISDDDILKDGIDHAVKECLIHETKDGIRTDQRYAASKSAKAYSAAATSGITLSPGLTPIAKAKEVRDNGKVKLYEKETHESYHEMQDKLLHIGELKLCEKYDSDGTCWYSRKDGSQIDTDEFCEAIDKDITKFFFNNVDLNPTSMSDAVDTSMQEAWMTDVVELVEGIAFQRIQLQHIRPNFLDHEGNRRIWEAHIKVIVSFMAAVAVLYCKTPF